MDYKNEYIYEYILDDYKNHSPEYVTWYVLENKPPKLFRGLLLYSLTAVFEKIATRYVRKLYKNDLQQCGRAFTRTFCNIINQKISQVYTVN